MAVNLVTVTGTLETLIGSAPTSAQLWFKLDRPDWNDAGDIFAPEHVAATITTGGAFTVALQSTDDYSNGATYTAILRYRDDNDGRQREYVLASFTLPSGGPYQLGDLLVTNPASSFNPNLNFTTRAAFIAAIPTLTHLQDGQSVFAGGYVYVRQAASTSIADAPGFIPGQFGDVIAAPSVLPYPIQPSMSGRTEDASRNVAAINAALAESASTGRQVKTPAGLFPVNSRITLPTGLPFYWINDRRTIFQPIYNNAAGFVAASNQALEITDSVIHNLTIRPAIDVATGNPFTGNAMVARLRRSEVNGLRAEGYWGDQAFLLMPYQSTVRGLYAYTDSTAGGTGACRILGGADSQVFTDYVFCGDDGLQFVPALSGTHANLSITNVQYIGGVASSNARPFLAFIDTALTANITNCGFVGITGISRQATLSTAGSVVVVSQGPGAVTGLQITGCSIDETARTVFSAGSHGLRIEGNVTDCTTDLTILEPQQQVMRMLSNAGTGLFPQRNSIRLVTNKPPRDGNTSNITILAGSRNRIQPSIYACTNNHSILVNGGDRTTIHGGRVMGIPAGFAGVRDASGTRTDVANIGFEGLGNSYSFAATPATTGRVYDCDFGGLTASGTAPTLSNNRA